MMTELQALQANITWSLVQLPSGKPIVGCRWVYKVKYKADGTLERYKARLVAQGFTQTLTNWNIEIFVSITTSATRLQYI